MNKKRLIGVMALVVVMVMSISLFTACGGTNLEDVKMDLGKEYFGENFTKMNHENMETTRLDAHDVLMDAYDYWVNSKGYKRTQYFTFEASAPAKHITNFTLDTYKVDGDKLYREMVVIQDSKPFKANRNDITRFYYDGTDENKAMHIVENDAKNIPGDPADMFKVGKKPAMKEFTGDDDGTVQERLTTYKSHLTTYIWQDAKNWARKGSKRVYKAEDGTYRFTMTIDCSKNKMDSVHMAARDEFLSSTGAAEDTLEMREDTTIDFVVEEVEVEGKTRYRFKAWRRTEQYQGEAMGLVAIPAKQTSIETFSYDEADYKITDADIA